MKKLPNRDLAFALLGVSVLFSGCLKIPASGVSVKSATANLVFGVPPIVEDVPPPGFEEAPPPVVASPKPSKPVVTPPPEPTEPCPEAGPFAHPEEVADTAVIGKPKEGVYFWKQKGRDKELTHPTRELPDFTFKAIGGITAGNENFDFMTGELERNVDSRTNAVTFEYVVQTFRVVQTGPGDKGIFLVKVARYQDAGSPQEFRPEPPVMMAKLPIKVPQEIRSAGVDPDTLAALTVTGELDNRFEIDACGKVIQTWRFKTQQQFTSATGANYNRTYHYGIATQFGGSIMYEYVEAPPAEAEQEPHLLYENNIGTLDPFPLSSEFKRFFV